MNYVVVGSLGKSTVYIAERLHALLCHAGRECHGMSLGYSHVKSPVWHNLHQPVHGASRRHGRRDSHYLRVHFCQFHQRLSEYVLIFWRLVHGGVLYPFARFRVELAGCVPYRCGFLGRSVALALYGVYVQQLRTAHVFKLAKYPHHFLHVIAVNRTEIAYVHALKHIGLRRQGRLQGVTQSDGFLPPRLVQPSVALHPRSYCVSPLVV